VSLGKLYSIGYGHGKSRLDLPSERELEKFKNFPILKDMRGKILVQKIREAFPPKQAQVLEELFDFLDELVKVHDFNELKAIVAEIAKEQKELAEAQKRTDEKMRELAEAQKRTDEKVKELAEAQKRTEEEIKRLAEAQKRTEEKVKELAEAQKRTEEEIKRLAEEHRKTRARLDRLSQDFGGFTRTYSYAFENEAYRNLPKLLKEKYDLEVIERFVRTEIEGEEINFFAKAKKNGCICYIVGEAKLRFDDNKRDFEKTFKEIEKKVQAVKKAYGDVEIIMLLVTHFAKPRALRMAQEKGILVVQSFEW